MGANPWLGLSAGEVTSDHVRQRNGSLQRKKTAGIPSTRAHRIFLYLADTLGRYSAEGGHSDGKRCMDVRLGGKGPYVYSTRRQQQAENGRGRFSLTSFSETFEEEMECVLNKFAGGAEAGTVGVLKDRAAI